MQGEIFYRGTIVLIFATLVAASFLDTYGENDDGMEDELEDYTDNAFEKLIQQAQEKYVDVIKLLLLLLFIIIYDE
ncbi:hypothetical protein Phum_PHUM086950 [Pediculus humanus corporis]|uniref:Uncharacterized protein n=1 Tax=Pediculus humanus subsp. corporis TaxID=121224 RepID=E0VCG7_PEDHC|nr:uncharacterized protein Phum_PHUM086950 [Pediculus humanus corporis]EEB11073.1 hypothetical protein Phum_PHUM086950 [Pediculus humanus corporis]